MPKEYTNIRFRRESYNRLQKLLADYIGKIGQPVSMVEFLDLLSRLEVSKIPKSKKS